MKRGLDWYKREPRAIIDAKRAAKMSTRTCAVYDLLLDLIYEGGGQTPDDPAYIAGHFPDIGTAVARREIEHLIGLGKIARDGAFLTNKRARNEAKTRQNLSETRAKAGQKGGISSGFSRSNAKENNDIPEASASSKTQAEKRERREEEGGGGGARAREASEIDQVVDAAQADVSKPGWYDFNVSAALRRWGELGLSLAEITGLIAQATASKRDGPANSPAYFDRLMAKAAGEKRRPALTPIDTPAPQQRRTRADDRLARLVSRLAPDDPERCAEGPEEMARGEGDDLPQPLLPARARGR